ncbi:MAG: zf-HC2 domain-containing protein [Armatimonadota bacterium]
MKDCNEIKNLLNEYIDREIANRAEIEKHIEACPDCATELEVLKRVSSSVKQGIIKDSLPSSFNQKLMSKIRSKKESKPSFSFFGLKPAYAFAAILIIFGIFIFFFTPVKDKFINPKQPEVVAYFTETENQQAENIFLVSHNDSTEEEALIDLFADDYNL